MNHAPEPGGRQFRAAIYAGLDGRLRASAFGGGAAEAHGVLSGLACRGAGGAGAAARALRLSASDDMDLIDGLRAMVERDLRADGFAFNLFLPGDDARAAIRVAAVADWCGGFMQGFLHDGDDALAGFPAAVREAFDDIMTISRADAPPADGDGDGDGEATERQLAEIEEYLRVAVQLIFEELNPPATPKPSPAASPPPPPPLNRLRG